MFHWKGGIIGGLVTVGAYVLDHSGSLVDLAGKYSGAVSTVIGGIGVLMTMFSNKVGAPKQIGDAVK